MTNNQNLKPETNEPRIMPPISYKNTIFRIIFSDKSNLLSLYNALNCSSYDNPDDLDIINSENSIFVGIKNDFSFLIESEINLFNTQSYICPNSPLRYLFVIADIYENSKRNSKNHIGRSTTSSTPKFVVFNDNTEIQQEKHILKLSDMCSYEDNNTNNNNTNNKKLIFGDSSLELKVTLYNLNLEIEPKILETCSILKEYMLYINKVRKYTKKMPPALAIETAISECVQENIMAAFLTKNITNIIETSIIEYNEAKVTYFLYENSK